MRVAFCLRLLPLLLACAVLSYVRPALAHGQRTAYVEAEESATSHLSIALRLAVPAPTIAVSVDGCTLTELSRDPNSLARAYEGDCTAPSSTRLLRLAGLGPIVDGATVHARLASGQEVSGWLTEAAPSLDLYGSRTTSMWRFLVMGAEHLARGIDHLLFLALLVLAVRRVRGVLAAETAFTLAHMTTFSLAALGIVRVASAPVEVCIALSLLLLALEVDLEHPLAARRAATQSFVFGLFHGLGFASGLRDLDVSSGNIARALVGFGAGLEVAQLALALGLLALVALLARMRAIKHVGRCVLLSGGATGAYLCIERSWALLVR